MLKRFFQKRYQPKARWGHSCVPLGNKAVVWGGMQAGLPEVHQSPIKTQCTSVVEVFDVRTAKWIQEKTIGNPPLGVRGQACAAVGYDLYFFGGFCGHDWCRHNTVYCLDTLTNVWREVVPKNPGKTPMKKTRCGMFGFSLNSEDYLCILGGTGLLCSANLTEATYIPWKENPDWGWTNELHFYALRNGTWIIPTHTGDIPPPCAGFTLTKISENSAILFGGYQPQKSSCVNDIYIMTIIDIGTVVWKKLEIKRTEGEREEDSSPSGRQDHTMVCLSSSLTGHNRTILLMLGGRSTSGRTFSDSWVLDIEQNRWTQVFLLESIAYRHFHSMVSVSINASRILVIVFGGVREWQWGKTASQQPALTACALIEAVATPDGDWKLGVVMGENDASPSEEYFQIVQQIQIREEEKKHQFLEIVQEEEGLMVVEEEEEEDEDEEGEFEVRGSTPLPVIPEGNEDELDTSDKPLQPILDPHAIIEPSSMAKASSVEGTHMYDVPRPLIGKTQASSVDAIQLPSRYRPKRLSVDSSLSHAATAGMSQRIKDLEQQLIIAKGRTNEVEEVLHKAIMTAEERAVIAEEKARAMEERAIKAEEKCREAEGRVLVLEGQVATLEGLLKTSEEKLCASYNDTIAYSEQVLELERQLLDSEDRAITAEIAINEIEAQVQEEKKKLEAREQKEKENENSITELEKQIAIMTEEMLTTAKGLREAEELIKFLHCEGSQKEQGSSQKPQGSSFWRALADVQHPSITLCFTEDDIITLSASTRSRQEVCTLEAECKQGNKLERQEVYTVSLHTFQALIHLHKNNLREKFDVSLCPHSVLLQKDEDKKICQAQLLVSLTNDDEPVSHENDELFTSLSNDLNQFALLLVTMATGDLTSNVSEGLATIEWPAMTELVSQCMNTVEFNDGSLLMDNILHQIEAMQMTFQ
ncbi:PREDICTED: uncharacterized protein LOC109587365 [Amphimedon queenslandica]|uniref:Uncharacterized protein n=1 Tax=Amphimedon queenslandica TaxID=400682 RepID=A0A1X7VRA3_AMPQE|nr:PREDICTED: uncharacterized protein LOC109587365 [Amphimedon queenslandica]|eukprot:XP_019859167.1 PREDICTED: uncharacterized protein LOC109587365 [Amphimedon queenslandica]